jgi:hypothetical protein
MSLGAEIPKYTRTEWDGWNSKIACSWSTRSLLLLSTAFEGSAIIVKSGRQCRISSFSFIDVYTGKVYTGISGSAVHVDHLVSLAEAHRSGGHDWSNEKKRAFFNDTSNLVVTMAEVNLGKSDLDPGGESNRSGTFSGWLPPDRGRSCWFLDKYVKVKKKWNLTYDLSEISSIEDAIKIHGCCPRYREICPKNP